MQKTATCFLLLILSTSFSATLKAQNLCPNFSFEGTVACPTGISEIANAVAWSSYRITPDYFNQCNNGQAGVPYNYHGYQNARTGNAYAGVIIFTKGGTGNVREYIGGQLNQSLDTGQKYYASFYISRALNKTQLVNIAANKIGMRFSTVPYSEGSPVPIDNHAQIYTDSIITDTINWVKISGSFIADSAYRYLSIGNFFKDSLTSYIPFDSVSNEAYYFIDDICISTDSVTCNGVGENINEISNSSIRIFPNPARDWIEIRGSEIQSLVLYDVLGMVIYASTPEISSPFQINTSSFSRGVYFLQARGRKGMVVRKVVLQ